MSPFFQTSKFPAMSRTSEYADAEVQELPPDKALGVYNGVPCGIRPKYILRPETRKGDEWHLTPNGSLAVPDLSSSFFPQTEYCLETVHNPIQETEGLMRRKINIQFSFFADDTNMEHVVYPGALLISCFFLFATLVVYALLPTLRNLHGLTLVSHASCLLAAFICLAAVKLTNQVMIRETVECKILGE
ncbi:hypothetical protein J437_LFUL005440 [Ladona fulva]|uniref:Uncharacterized protein n=1 Tax=Ladona fulva TaxID=123851 RepID=A0A8K0JWC7_LADFU|nr:hypothetical protein J437_LFUL005440 [Ladona fulva]